MENLYVIKTIVENLTEMSECNRRPELHLIGGHGVACSSLFLRYLSFSPPFGWKPACWNGVKFDHYHTLWELCVLWALCWWIIHRVRIFLHTFTVPPAQSRRSHSFSLFAEGHRLENLAEMEGVCFCLSFFSSVCLCFRIMRESINKYPWVSGIKTSRPFFNPEPKTCLNLTCTERTDLFCWVPYK